MQNRIYLDTNIFLELLVNEDKFEKYKKVRSDFDSLMNTKKTLYSCVSNNGIFVVNTSSLTNAYFLLTERCGLSHAEVATEFLKLEQQSKFFMIIEENKDLRVEAQRYCQKNNEDYEDVLQYFCAKYAGCDLIITNDKKFPKLDIPLKRTDPNIPDYIPTQDKSDKSISDLKKEFNEIFSNTPVDTNKAEIKRDKQ